MTVLAVLLLWAAYLVREVLLLLYISRTAGDRLQPDRPADRAAAAAAGRHAGAFPRWLAILVLYVFIIGTFVGIGMLVFPPLIDQAQEFWAQKEQMFEQGAAVPARTRAAARRADHARASRRARAAGGRRHRCGGDGVRRRPRRARRDRRVPDDPDRDLLPAGRLLEPAPDAAAAVPACASGRASTP